MTAGKAPYGAGSLLPPRLNAALAGDFFSHRNAVRANARPDERCAKGPQCGFYAESRSAFSCSAPVSCRSSPVRARTRHHRCGGCLVLRRSRCNGRRAPRSRARSAPAWTSRLIPRGPTGCALRCGSAACRPLDPAQRKGALLFIPRGPGAGIAKIIGGDSRTAQHVDEFRRQWDVASFDPRGIEGSSPIRCSPELVRPAAAPTDHPPTAAEFAALARQCSVHRKLSRGDGRVDAISLGHQHGGRRRANPPA